MARLALTIFGATFACLLLTDVVSSNSVRRIPRAIKEDNKESKICSKSTPCGWAIYKPYTREVVDYMPNTCKCSADLACIRVDDDLSVSAYVHRCRPKLTDSDDNQLFS